MYTLVRSVESRAFELGRKGLFGVGKEQAGRRIELEVVEEEDMQGPVRERCSSRWGKQSCTEEEGGEEAFAEVRSDLGKNSILVD